MVTRKVPGPYSLCLLACVAAFCASRLTGQTTAELSLAAQEEQAFRAAVDVVAPSVVQIRTVGGLDQVDQQLVAAGPTTGLIISQDGYILSSAFNFAQRPTSILVRLPSGEQAPAELVATDHSRMLVLLKVESPSPLPVPTFAPADEVQVGAWAIAVGRTFSGDRPNVSVGIISAAGRMFGRVVQTDAAVSLANYGGPLIDLYGRVVGLIVPMSPQASSELAGAQWYDSGIGFAVPLESLVPHIEQMKQGEDLYAGLLGVGLTDGSAYESPAEIATVRPQSPAYKAGIEQGDRIVEVNGQTILAKTDLRFQLGPRYAGEQLNITIARGDDRFERQVTLSGPLGAYRHAFLGVLPMRTVSAAEQGETDREESSGVEVRAVYDDSPAQKAGLAAGDCILQLNGKAIGKPSEAITAMNSVAVGDEVQLRVLRSGTEKSMSLTAVDLPTLVPMELPAARSQDTTEDTEETNAEVKTDDSTKVGIVELTFPEFSNKCQLYVPRSAAEGIRPGVVIWLQPFEEESAEKVLNEWRPLCDAHDLLLVVPSPAEGSNWSTDESGYLRRLLMRVVIDYNVDRNRVVVHGRQQAGGMAYVIGFAGRQVVRGISVAGAATPRGIEIPDAEPQLRLAVHSAQPDDVALAGRLRSGHRNLVAAGYPVTLLTITDPDGRLSADEPGALVRWIDTLDRF